MTEEEFEEDPDEGYEAKQPKGKFWLIVIIGVAVIGVAAYLIFHHPAAAATTVKTAKDLPTMVGGC